MNPNRKVNMFSTKLYFFPAEKMYYIKRSIKDLPLHACEHPIMLVDANARILTTVFAS